jgi:hypothetical protein
MSDILIGNQFIANDGPFGLRGDELRLAPPGGSFNNEGGRTSFTILGEPIGKLRETQRDKWTKPPVVEKFCAWADEFRLAATALVEKDVSRTSFGFDGLGSDQ